RNLGAQALPATRVSLSLGTAAPNNADDPGLQLKTGFSNGSDQKFIARADLEAGNGLFGIGAHGAKPYVASDGPLTWTAVKNQFFTSIRTGHETAASLR